MQSRIDYTLFEGCTEGPWHVVTMRGWSGGDPVIGRRPQDVANTTAGDAPIAKLVRKASHWDNEYPVLANANLIASAPILLEEHKALMEENERLRGTETFRRDEYCIKILSRQTALQEEVKSLREALALAHDDLVMNKQRADGYADCVGKDAGQRLKRISECCNAAALNAAAALQDKSSGATPPTDGGA